MAYLQDTIEPLVSKGLLHFHVMGPLIQDRLKNGGSETDLSRSSWQDNWFVCTNKRSVSHMERNQKEGDTGKSQILNNAAIFIAAGSGTTASWLSASVYYILANPDVKSKLVDEIRNAASKRSDLNLDIVNGMKYLKAVTDESIRIMPPILSTFTRVVPRGGVSICGKYVAQSTVVGVNHWATYHSAKNFKHPDEFHPERWLDVVSEEFAGDHRNALQPFSYGPRKCIAQEMASMHSKLFLARLFWEFDMELAPGSRDWAQMKGFIAHYKIPLMVKSNKKPTLSETET
ncbi:Cytochrome P450 monooxygenase [Lachnellula occidentalis]|uniref:Cytochrome P450 monooxygenase n=1 Tax=Lachnellula occidentalis TaxID=215460 RepID=A0A8H8UKJ6_9HELO|nr:Cytochrome P450 monooxygenase [Lachnellula occidentalis]